MIAFGAFRYDSASGLLYRGDEEILLPPRVVAVLESLLKRPGKIVPKDDLLASAWDGAFVGEDSLTQAISQLRRVLGDDPQRPTYIQTVPRRGYRLIAAVSEPLRGELEPVGPDGQRSGARSLTPGLRLGRYEVVARLGAGAMGEVWEARDTELDRTVAIKVVPPELGADPRVMERFRREARMLAAVDHPNIATIFGVEEEDGTRLIAMELLQGETLEERLHEGPLPIADALAIALQVAEALEAAHERGIIHRDLKPANVVVGDMGRVKVVDFGLAKITVPRVHPVSEASAIEGEADSDASEADQESLGSAAAPHDAPDLTASGVILGTARYMSPEQASGQALDKRTDIWAFGCVLLEMLSGRPAFPGDLAAAIRAEPEWDRFPSNVHPHLRHVVRRCLEKDLRARWHDIADVRGELETIRADPRGATLPSSSAAAAGLPIAWMTAGIAAALVVGAIAGGILAPGPGAPTMRESLRYWITDEDGDHDQLVVTAGAGIDMRLSPDGSELVYLGRREGTRLLYRRSLGSGVTTALPRTDGATQPFFSPDGRWLGFFSEGTLERMQFPAGAPIGVVDLGGNPSGATWLADDTIVVGMRQTGLVRIAASDGDRETLTVPDPQRGDTAHNWPEALPGGAGVLFTALHGPDLANARIAVWSADAEDWSIVLDEEGYNARYVTSGHLIYGRADVLWAVPFDAERLQVTGNPEQVLDDRVVTKPQGAQAFAVSSNGTLAFAPSYVRTDEQLVWMVRDGTLIEPVGAPVYRYRGPDVSPDGKRIVVGVDGKAFMYNIENGSLEVLPGADRNSFSLTPSWSPDGSTIAFILGGSLLYTVPADGSGSAYLVWESPVYIWGPPKWSPDGEFILVNTLVAESGSDVWRVSLDDGQPAPYLQGPGDEAWPAFSPSGSWVAYSSSESGRSEIYARPFPDSAGGRVQISVGGGAKPLWFGDEVFYRRDEQVWSVRIEETATDLEILGHEQLPVVLPYEGSVTVGYDYDYDPVNGRFLVVRPVIENPGPRIHVVVNWFAEIAAQMSARK